MDRAPFLHIDNDARVIFRRLFGGALFLCLVTLTERASLPREFRLTVPQVVDSVSYWLFWVILSVPALFIIRRINQQDAVAKQLMGHALTVVVIMFCHSIALLAVQQLGHQTDLNLPLWTGAFYITRWRITGNLLAYGAIVAVIRFSDAERAAQAGQRAAVRLAEQLSTAQLEALRLQLNPHFLFNSLNSVAMLVRRGAASEAVRAITILAELLRHLLRSPVSQFVSLRDELALLNRYFDLERLRFGDRLRIVHEIDEAALDASVPPFLLQPIVENAIRHGIARSMSGGTLRITAKRVDVQLQIEIADDGPGMDANRTGPLGVGLSNTMGRLTELYGPTFHFDVRSASTGTVAHIAFPAMPPNLVISSSMSPPLRSAS